MQRPMVLAVIPLLVAAVRHGPGTEVKIQSPLEFSFRRSQPGVAACLKTILSSVRFILSLGKFRNAAKGPITVVELCIAVACGYISRGVCIMLWRRLLRRIHSNAYHKTRACQTCTIPTPYCMEEKQKASLQTSESLSELQSDLLGLLGLFQ